MNPNLRRVLPGLPRWEASKKITIGFSQREDGGMSFNRLPISDCVANRERFFHELNIELSQTVWAELVHENRVELINRDDTGRGAYAPENAIAATDGLWTTAPKLVLCTTHADCLPVYFLASDVPAVGVAHCGWRSIVAGLPERMIETAVNKIGARQDQIMIGIGPGIRTECFEVGEEILDSFPPNAIVNREGKWYVDLVAVIQTNLFRIGVTREQIEDSGICSRCTPIFSSYRRDRSTVAPAVAFIALTE